MTTAEDPTTNKEDIDEVDVACPSCGHEFVVEVETVPNPNTDSVDPGPWHKLGEVEQRLCLSRKSVKNHIYSGKLEARKFGDGRTAPWHVSEQAIQKFLRNGK